MTTTTTSLVSTIKYGKMFFFYLQVMSKFKVLLSGYSQMPPALFVICGNFLSQPYGSKHLQVLRNCFQELSKLWAGFPILNVVCLFYSTVYLQNSWEKAEIMYQYQHLVVKSLTEAGYDYFLQGMLSYFSQILTLCCFSLVVKNVFI